MHALWHSIRERDPKQRVLYLTAESFVNRFIQALRTKNTNQFKELFRNVDVLMVDDVQFICGKEASQDEFFFTFNSLVEQNKQIVLSSEKPPSELQDIEERMRSRLGSGLLADIHSSTYERRPRSVARPRQVAMYLAKQLTTLSLPQIGKRFGNRDHTTVMHAVRKIEELKISDLSIAEDVELLKRQLQG